MSETPPPVNLDADPSADMTPEDLSILDAVEKQFQDAARPEIEKRLAELSPEERAEWQALMAEYAPKK